MDKFEYSPHESTTETDLFLELIFHQLLKIVHFNKEILKKLIITIHIRYAAAVILFEISLIQHKVVDTVEKNRSVFKYVV